MKTLYIRTAISKLLDVQGECKWLSAGPDKCPCAMCQVDRMRVEEIEKLASEIEIKFPDAKDAEWKIIRKFFWPMETACDFNVIYEHWWN